MVNLHFIDFLKCKIKKRAMIKFGYLRQSYCDDVPLVPP